MFMSHDTNAKLLQQSLYKLITFESIYHGDSEDDKQFMKL